MGRYAILQKALTGFKKVWNKDTAEWVVIELEIPVGATVHFSLFTNKCRASCARVTSGSGVSHYDSSMEYRAGIIVEPRNGFATEAELDENESNPTCYSPQRDAKHTCAGGIHFYLDHVSAQQHFPR